MVIMALDHVRDFFLISATDKLAAPDVDLAVFTTRWITHICAPVFIFLTGTSAGLMQARKEAKFLGWFLLTRGLWLILVECLIISNISTFAPWGLPQLNGSVVVILQVFWAIGASMVVLAAMQFMGRRVCLGVGLGILLCHNLLDTWWPQTKLLDETTQVWIALLSPMAFRVEPILILFSYPLLPWTGVMLVGFGMAQTFELAAEQRSKNLFRLGVSLTTLFLIVRGVNVYGDPQAWVYHEGEIARSLISFLSVQKYPPSLSFLLMTLGPAAIFCSFAEHFPRKLEEILLNYGRAPFIFYVMHLLFIHGLSVLLGVLQGFEASQFLTMYPFFPKGFGVPLAAVYPVWILLVAMLYPLCAYVSKIKARRKDWWLSYI